MDQSVDDENNLNKPDTICKDSKEPTPGPNVGTGDPTDGRKPYEWATHYHPTARKEIRYEAFFLIFIFILSFILIACCSNCVNIISIIYPLLPNDCLQFRKFLLYASSGMLGGSVFGIKYFYRVVARGYWHQDRRVWRLMSPMLAMTIAFIIGAMIDASFLTSIKPLSKTTIISIGFLSGYFADDAVGKMYEIANVLFGKSSSTRAGDGK